MFTMRFDMRAKDGRHTTAALYEAALEMAVWAEREGGEEFGQPEAGYFAPEPGAPESVFVSDDLDRAWDDIGEYLLHDARMYASWLGELEAVTKSRATSVKELRAEEANYRIFTVGEAIEHIQARGYLPLQPLCGGIPPALAWESLALIAAEVLPAVRAIRSA